MTIFYQAGRKPFSKHLKRRIFMRKIISILVIIPMALLLAAGCDGKDDTGGNSRGSSESALESSVSNGSGGDETSSVESNNASGENSKGGTNSKTNSAQGKSTTQNNSSVSSKATGKSTIKIASSWAETWYNQPKGKKVYSDLMANVFSAVQKKYGIKIQVSALDTTNLDIIIRAINAGSAPYDLLELQTASARRLALKNALFDQKKLTKLNLNASAFSSGKALGEALTFNGKQYASAFGYPYSSVTGVFVNTTVLKKYGQPDVQTLVGNGTWNFNQYRTIAKNVKDKSNGAVWGTANSTNIVGMAFTANAGGTIVRKNGNYEISMLSQDGIDAAKWIQDMYVTDKSFNYMSSGLRGAMDFFAQGKAAFVPSFLEFGDSLMEMKDDYTFVPFPKGFKKTAYTNGVYSGKMFAIPSTAKEAQFIGQIYSEIAEKANSGITAMYKQYLIDRGMDSKGIAIAMDMAKYMTPDFAVGVDVSNLDPKINGAIFNANGNIASVFASITSLFESKVDEYYGNYR